MGTRVAFASKPIQDGIGSGPAEFIVGDMTDQPDGSVILERLIDKPEPVPGQGVVPCRLFSVSPTGEPGWRPHGQVGPWEKGTRVPAGVLYAPKGENEPAYLVPIQVRG